MAYTYDGCTNGLGRLCSVTAGTTTRSYNYDVAGRVESSQQSTDGTSYQFQYRYNLADGLESIQYPSGRVVGYC